MTDPHHATVSAYTIAVTQLLLGNRKMRSGVAILGGDPLDKAGRLRVANMLSESQIDAVHLEFSIRPDGSYGISGINVIVPRDHRCFVQADCQLWLSKAGDRAVILPNDGSRGHFLLTPQEIVHLDGKPADALSPGVRRAEAWLERQVASRPAGLDNVGFFQLSRSA